jgi:NAD(P)H-hydrate epimerase
MITAQDMQELEKTSGIPSLQLMENAGKAFVEELKKHHDVKGKKLLVACYHGKNAGDGFVIADVLSKEAEVDVLFIGDEEKMPSETAHFFHKLNHNPLVQFVTLETADFEEYDLLIDAILGINIHNYLKPEIASTIKLLNQAPGYKVAVDIPTGLHPENGTVVEEIFNADLVITFHDLKPALEQLGEKVKVVGIGL